MEHLEHVLSVAITMAIFRLAEVPTLRQLDRAIRRLRGHVRWLHERARRAERILGFAEEPTPIDLGPEEVTDSGLGQ